MDFTQDFAHPQSIAAVLGGLLLGLGLSLELVGLRWILRDRQAHAGDAAPAAPRRRPRLA
jgi:hypothetical protein